MKFLFSLLFLLPALAACSVYRSEGRKFLEEQAFTYSGASAYQNLVSCQVSADSDGRALISASERVRVFGPLSDDGLTVRVVRLGDSPFSCDYGFTNADEMNERLPSAIDLTLHL